MFSLRIDHSVLFGYAVSQMSSRVDALEASIQDIINGDISTSVSVPQSPSPAPSASGNGARRNDNGNS